MNKTPLKFTALKLGVFTLVMLLILAGLVVVFSQYRTGTTEDYHAVFENASSLESGDKVAIAGVTVGTVNGVHITDDNQAMVDFNVDEKYRLSTTTEMAVRYKDLVGNRYVELIKGAEPGTPLGMGATIPVERTEPALDLDTLLGGFKPLFKALDPQQVNMLAKSLIDVFQGQGQQLVSLLGSTSSFSKTLADRDQLIGDVIGNLNAVLGTMDQHKQEFSGIVDNVQKVVSTLAASRDAVVGGTSSINDATGTMASLLEDTRPDLKGDVAELDRLMGLLSTDEATSEFDWVLSNMPAAFRQVVRVGTYGAFFNFYLCGVTFKVGDENNPIYIPLKNQTTGRCAPVDD
ncbi:MCE family protein [Tomitella fengzijianii]|uniref:MCE family protein n=1 Tax=Tomitella fengzijianii TaxID=2597660 RepID=UPI0018EF2E17|nr:MCE family protein [Tomitella fengzijianii]